MLKPLLSIVVPTKNRYTYLEEMIRLFVSFQMENTELIVQDNSDDNTNFLDFMLQFKQCQNIKYHYMNTHLSVCENCDKAILNSSGKYVCMIGDDDGFLRDIEKCVAYMESDGIDSLIANKPAYKWPDVHGVVFDFSGTVRVEKYTGKIEIIDLSSEMKKMLKSGAITLGRLPCVYHGIVKRDVLNQIFAKTGTFFPGPSPDMANAVALGLCSTKHVYYDNPVIISGHGAKSAGGMGAKHQHQNEIKNLSFLPPSTDKLWEKRVPKYWTGETIYAESAIKALKKMREEDLVSEFNYHYLFGAFCAFHFPQFRLAFHSMHSTDFLFLPYYIGVISFLRLKILFRNYCLKKGFGRGIYLHGSLSSMKECESYIFSLLK